MAYMTLEERNELFTGILDDLIVERNRVGEAQKKIIKEMSADMKIDVNFAHKYYEDYVDLDKRDDEIVRKKHAAECLLRAILESLEHKKRLDRIKKRIEYNNNNTT